MIHPPDRMFDDDAPITDGDVREARRFLRLLRGLGRAAAVGGLIVGALAVVVVDDWLAQQAMRRRCGERARETIAALERQDPPAHADLHRGEGGVLVIDTHEVAALLVDGRVVGSTLRCAVGDEFPARAWLGRPVL